MQTTVPERLKTGHAFGQRVAWAALLTVASTIAFTPAWAKPPSTLPVTAVPPQSITRALPPVAGAPAGAKPADRKGPAMTMETFLDRLMMAESGGRLDARNSRSTAVGPYQFIERTFLDVARRNFVAETQKLSDPALLTLRTNAAFSRKVAAAYTQENANHLVSAGVASTFPHLRLAFFLGPSGAVRVLSAPPRTPMAGLVSQAALIANPFLYRLTAADLVARAAREVSLSPTATAGVTGIPGAAKSRAAGPSIAVKCNLRRPSCRKWLALQKQKLTRIRSARSAGRVREARNGRR